MQRLEQKGGIILVVDFSDDNRRGDHEAVSYLAGQLTGEEGSYNLVKIEGDVIVGYRKNNLVSSVEEIDEGNDDPMSRRLQCFRVTATRPVCGSLVWTIAIPADQKCIGPAIPVSNEIAHIVNHKGRLLVGRLDSDYVTNLVKTLRKKLIAFTDFAYPGKPTELQIISFGPTDRVKGHHQDMVTDNNLKRQPWWKSPCNNWQMVEFISMKIPDTSSGKPKVIVYVFRCESYLPHRSSQKCR